MTEPVRGLGGEADEPRTAPMQVPAPDPATPVAAATAPSRDESGLTKPPESAEPERGPGSE
ncbi:MAG TPA: hypothetical protein VNY84_12820, partial [Acidimicrobiales bacterium]|nr:hypothetical protein [Acidimicrobiales bacterium]